MPCSHRAPDGQPSHSRDIHSWEKSTWGCTLQRRLFKIERAHGRFSAPKSRKACLTVSFCKFDDKRARLDARKEGCARPITSARFLLLPVQHVGQRRREKHEPKEQLLNHARQTSKEREIRRYLGQPAFCVYKQ